MAVGKGTDQKLNFKELKKLQLQESVALAARCALRVAPGFRISSDIPPDDAVALIEAAHLLSWLAGLVGFIDGYDETVVMEHLSRAALIAEKFYDQDWKGYKAGRVAMYASSLAGVALQTRLETKGKGSIEKTGEVTQYLNSALKAAESIAEDHKLAVEFLHSVRQDLDILLKSDGTYDLGNQPFWPDGTVPPPWVRVMDEWQQMLKQYELDFLYDNYEDASRGGFDWETPDIWMRDWGEKYAQLSSEPVAEQIMEEDAVPLGRASALTDKLAEEDRLGRTPLIESLAALFTGEQDFTPLTLGILGEWGSGKSSVMQLVQSKLNQDHKGKFEFAWFNAWSYEHVSNISAALAQEVVEGLTKNVKYLRRLLLVIRYAWFERNATIAWLIIGLELSVIFGWFAVASGIGDYGAKIIKDYPGLSFFGGFTALVGASVYAWKALRKLWEHPFSRELKTFLQLPKYGTHLGLGPELRRQIETLCRLRLGRPPWQKFKQLFCSEDQKSVATVRRRLIVFVDDLDRCSRKFIMQTLEAIRLIMDIKDVIVIIAIDQRIALGAVAAQYRALKGGRGQLGGSPEILARHYLGKIIQIALRLGNPTQDDLSNFIYQALFERKESPPRPDQPADEHTAAQPDSDSLKPEKTSEKSEQTVLPLSKTPEEVNQGPTNALITPDVGSEDQTTPLTEEKSPGEEAKANAGPIVDLQLEMEESEGEIEFFRDLAFQHEFSNPRQLLRLRNSYRLLKLLNAYRSEPMPHTELLRMLFWQEFLHQWPKHVQLFCKNALFSKDPPKDPPRNISGEVFTVIRAVKEEMLTMFINENPGRYDQVSSFVRLLVLPSS